MKQGLLFKEAIEPLTSFTCKCNQVFYYVDEYKKHRLDAHGQRLEYFLEEDKKVDYEFSDSKEFAYSKVIPGQLTKKWLKPNESQGLMNAPLYVPKRPVKRYFATLQQLTNIENGICHCGNSFKWPRRKHCSDECANKYCYEMFTVWSIVRNRFIRNNAIQKVTDDEASSYGKSWKCEHCSTTMHSDYQIEIDHIIAIMFGGHPWDERNFQLLCHDCHVIKTRSDRQIQKFWRDTQYYDAVFVRGDNSQKLLESFSQA